MTAKPDTKHICVMKTGRLFEHDMAANALSEYSIPFYKQFENSTGLILAMPFQPAMGPGDYYSILVPVEFEKEARQVLNTLPMDVTTEPDFWHFNPNAKEKAGWKIYVWGILATSVIFLIASIIKSVL